MRNIDGSEWLSEPALDVVATVESGTNRASEFTLFAQQVSMANEGDDIEQAEQSAPPRRPQR
jgi:hypothetical protein